MKKILYTMLVALLLVTGCSKNEDAAKEGQEITITHKLGETTLKTNPEKVVIFDMGILDTFHELGLPVQGIVKQNLPDALKEYEDDKYFNAGTLFEPNLEEIHSQEPELIIISGRASDNYDALSKIAPTIYMGVQGDDLTKSIQDNLDVLVTIFPNEGKKINKEKDAITKQIADLNKKISEKELETLFVLANGDAISLYNEAGRYGFVYKDFGFKFADTDPKAQDNTSTHGQEISFEYLANVNPKTIIVMDRGQIVGSDTNAQKLLDNDLVNNTQAFKDENILYVNPQVWYIMTGGLSATKTMVEELSALVK